MLSPSQAGCQLAKSWILLLLVSSHHKVVSAIGVKVLNPQQQAIPEDESMAPWQNCEVFMAPTNTSTGWGVFANRDFKEGELVDITPLHFYMRTRDETIPSENRVVQSTSLGNYVYSAMWKHLDKYESNVLFGYEMMYNHHPTDPNVKLVLGHHGHIHSFHTMKRIRMGEEIVSSYSSQDGGKDWFELRNMTMSGQKAVLNNPGQIDFLSSQYCTKIYAGAGPETFQRLYPSLDESRVAPFDAGLNDARAKVPIKAGERIEQAPAMLLYKPFVKGTALGPLVITWDTLRPEHQTAINSASAPIGGKLPIEYRGPGSDWQQVRRMTKLENVAILPFAGRIGMVRRVNSRSSLVSSIKTNCRLEIGITVHHEEGRNESEEDGKPRVSVVLELIATEDIPTGGVLLMDLKPAGTAYERELLKVKLNDIGHPFNLA
jgi:hypothetical protein